MDILNPTKDAQALAAAEKPLLQMTLGEVLPVLKTLFADYKVTYTGSVTIEKVSNPAASS